MKQSDPTPHEPPTNQPVWHRLSQRLRQLTDQAGRSLGQLTDFEPVKQYASATLTAVPPDLDPLARVRQQLPNLSRQLLLGRFARVGRLASQLMPQELLERLIDQILDQSVQLAERLSSNDALYDEFNLLSLHDVAQLSIERADELADLIASRNRVLAAAEGAATGVAGVIGLIADLPLSVILVLRVIYQTAECYGYDLTDVEGRQTIYHVLADTQWSVLIEKQALLLSLASVQQLLKQQGIAGLQQMVGSAGDLDVFEKLVQDMAGSLNIRLPENLIGRSLPLAGGIVGALYNTRLLNAVAATAQARFRQQRLSNPTMITHDTQVTQVTQAPTPSTAHTQPPIETSIPIQSSTDEISAEAVFGHSAADEQVKPQPKKRMVRVKKTSDGEIVATPTQISPNNDTQH